MPGTQEIRRRLVSVRNTRKITSAMKLVSAAKLRKAQDAVVRSREYTNALNSLLGQLVDAGSLGNFEHPLLQERAKISKIKVIVVGGSRGLCGGYNSNVNKAIEAFVKQHEGVQIEWTLVGKKPAEYLRRTKRTYAKSFEELPEDPTLWPIADIANEAVAEFESGAVDQVVLLYTRFKSALSMKVVVDKLLPLSTSDILEGRDEGEGAGAGSTKFEPSVQEIFAAALPRIVRTKVLQSGLDAKASEHSSRMTAMEAATKNADDLGRKLQLTYNKVRQSGITSELLDIIGGAEAIN